MVKRITPEEDVDRLAERIFRDFPRMEDREDFDEAFNEFIGEPLSQKQDTQLRNRAFQIIQMKHQLRDKVKPDKKIRRARQKQRRFGGIRITTPKPKPKIKQDFKVLGFIKKRVVFGRFVTIHIRGKRIKRAIDKKGRFIRIKK